MSAPAPQTNSEFAARLQRIHATKGQSTIMVGQDEKHVITRKQRLQMSRQRELAQNLAYPASLLGALGLGMLGVAFGRYTHFQLLSGAGSLRDPTAELAFIAIFGLITAFVLSQMFKLTSKQHRALQSLGVFLMVGLFHNLAHWLPTPMRFAFSDAWVQQIVTTTPANSFRFGQSYIPLVQTPPRQSAATCAPAAVATTSAGAAKPTILQLDPHKIPRRKTLQAKAAAPAAAAVAPQDCVP